MIITMSSVNLFIELYPIHDCRGGLQVVWRQEEKRRVE
jgi:hypothetical protein